MNDTLPPDSAAPEAAPAPLARPTRKPRAAAPAAEGYAFADVVSGVLDADEERTDLPAPKRVLLPQPNPAPYALPLEQPAFLPPAVRFWPVAASAQKPWAKA